jgi:hypothetical protein
MQRVAAYMRALAGGSSAGDALQMADALFATLPPAPAPAPAALAPERRRSLLQSESILGYLPSATPNPALPTASNTPVLGELPYSHMHVQALLAVQC